MILVHPIIRINEIQMHTIYIIYIHNIFADMFIKLFARNNQHLLEIIHTKLQPIGLSRTETLISFREIFRRQLPIEEVENMD